MAAVCFVLRAARSEQTRGDFVTFFVMIGAWRASVYHAHI
tara:strand:- start:88 stop:207 length:120 start_codon:yes stop_codon:yes gene_type:complete